MKAPSKDPARSNPELDYAPPWARENLARENMTRANMARENMAREQLRPPLGERTSAEEIAAGASHTAGDEQPYDRPWHHRALEPELVPEPPGGVPNFWPTMLRMGIVCTIAAIVAASVVLLFNPKQGAHKGMQANGPPPASIAENGTSIEVPALTAEKAASASGAPVEPPPDAPGVAVRPPALASTTPTQPRANLEAPAPPVNQAPLPQQPPREAPPASDTPPTVQATAVPEAGSATSTAVKQSPAKPTVTLDDEEISTLIKRGHTFLKDGDFAAARLLFERAADAGSAEAALALGSTYDPLFIKRLGGIAVKPDIENARKWYQIAADRGSAAAKLQLANLPPSH